MRLVPVKCFPEKENVFRLFGCLGNRFPENQFRCLVRPNILRKSFYGNQTHPKWKKEVFVFWKKNHKRRDRENSTPIGVTLFFSNGINPERKVHPKKLRFLFLFDSVWNKGVLWFLFRFPNPLILLIALVRVLLVLKVNFNYKILN